jgi:ribosomal protein S3
MILKKHKKEISNYRSIKNIIAWEIGALILGTKGGSKAIVHYFDVKKHLFKNKVTVTIYCERPGLLIGERGSTVDKLKSAISKSLNKEVAIIFVDFEPIIYPINHLFYEK